jgi:hypothetical protein
MLDAQSLAARASKASAILKDIATSGLRKSPDLIHKLARQAGGRWHITWNAEGTKKVLVWVPM